ncbi:MAG: AAA family ATPase [Lachnospiraceae bacterium]
MVLWELIVEDYGKIKSAEIKIAPLTLFVGDNNSGKSYLLALLWGIEKFGVEALIGNNYIDTEEVNALTDWLCTQIDFAVENKKHKVALAEVSNLLSELLNTELKKNKRNLVKKIFNSNSVDIGKLEIRLGDLDGIILHFEMDEKEGLLKMFINNGKTFGIGGNIIKEGMYRKVDFLNWILVKVLYRFLLNIGIDESEKNESIYLPAARTGFMLTKDIINKVGRKNTFNLSGEKETITPFIRPINQFLDIMGDLSTEAAENEKKIKLAHDLESELANGTVEVSAMPNKEVQYIPTGYKKGIPLRLSSAVVTELSPLILILKHQDEVKRLYYEEPEMCLHPQLQYKMGKMIGRIVNSGIGMVITTHSDIIVQHINNMIKLTRHKDCKDICEKLGYTQLDLLSHEQVRVYQLKAKTRGKTEVEELHCGEDGFAVPTFNDALDAIMNESYEIQG